MLAKWEAPEDSPESRNIKEGTLLKLSMACGVLWPWLRHGEGLMWATSRVGEALLGAHPDTPGALQAEGFSPEAVTRILQAGPRNLQESQRVREALIRQGADAEAVDQALLGRPAVQALKTAAKARREEIAAVPQGYTAIPVYAVKAAAGPAYENGVEEVADEVLFSTAWLRHGLRLDPSKTAVVHVEGDSMETVLSSGDLVVVDLRPESRRGDGTFLLRHGQGLLVKGVQRLPGGSIRILSRNPAYPPFEVGAESGEDLEVVGRVACAVRRM
jgi:phage repressor protein C with HTH and peptisase S24 domain